MSSQGAPSPPPGWYRQQDHSVLLHYWDGRSWTQQTRPAIPPPPPLDAWAASPPQSELTKFAIGAGSVILLIVISVLLIT